MLSDIYCKETYGLFETSIVQQTAFWSEVKKKLGIESIAIDFKCQKEYLKQEKVVPHDVQSDVLLVIQRLDSNHCIAYVPYGPELSPQQEYQGRFLEELSESLRPFLPKGCIMIRYDLCWESLWAKDKSFYNENGEWNGPPEKKSQELRFNINTQFWNLFKAQTNILPSNTLYLNLKPSTEDILEQMKPKTRYNIGLSKRKGVEVRHAGIDELDVWYELYKETAIRNGIYLHDVNYFKAVLNTRASNTLSDAEVSLMIAGKEQIPLAAMFLVMSGQRASYLYGASSSANKPFMGSYALQWEAIQYAKFNGCTQYDMFGVSPASDNSHPMYGLYRFKSGFGGQMIHRMGCWDYPFDSGKYACFASLETQSQSYRVR